MQDNSEAPEQDSTLRLGQLALARKLINAEQLRSALAEQSRSLSEKKQPRPLGNILLEKGYLTDEQLSSLLDDQRPKGAVPGRQAASPSHPSLGKYEIIRELGRGGMGVVYEAVDSALGRKVALKMMLVSPHADAKEAQMEEERFLREARISAGLAKHPNIVSVYEAGVVDGKRYLAMELVEGMSFTKWRKSGSVTIRQQVQLLRDVALGVHHAHKQGTIHRDLKPDNILIDAQNQPHVTDFGLAKSVGQNVHLSLTASGMIMGTPSYMSPEQALGQKDIDHRTDVYALGVMLYETLTGRLPFTGETAIEILMKASKEPVPPPSSVVKGGANPTLDRAIENICLKSLAKKAKDRYPTAEAFAHDLTKWLKGEDVHVRVAVPTRRKAIQPRTSSSWVYAGIAGAVLLAVGVILALSSTPPTQDDPARLEADRKVRREKAQLDLEKAAAEAEIDRLKRERDLALRDAEEARKRAENAKTAAERDKANEELRRAEERSRAAEADSRKKEPDIQKSEPPGQGPSPAAAGAWINLLPRIDPDTDAVHGHWRLEGGAVVSDRPAFARLEIPYEPPEEYDFRIRFAILEGNPNPGNGGDVVQLLPHGGVSTSWQMAGFGNRISGFGLSGTVEEMAKPPNVVREQWFQKGKSYESTVRVRKDGMSSFLDGSLVCTVPREFRSPDHSWALRDERLLGLASYYCVVKFQAVEVLEVSGRGAFRTNRPAKVDGPWLKSVAASPPADQVRLVVEKLRELNPGFDGRVEPRMGKDGVSELVFPDAKLRNITPLPAFPRLEKIEFKNDDKEGWFSDLEPLRGMSLRILNTGGAKIADLTPLRGMPLRVLVCDGVSDLSPLAGMTLEFLYLNGRGTFSDLAPLRSMATLRGLGCNYSRVSDLTPISGLRLEHLDISYTDTVDLSPIRKMPLLHFNCEGTRVKSLSPLQGMPLKDLICDFDPARDTAVLKSIRSLEAINGQAVSEFWKSAETRPAAAPLPSAPRSLMSGAPAIIWTAAFTSDSKRCISASTDQKIRIWDVGTGRKEREINEGTGVFCVALRRPDDKVLVSGNADGTVKLWDLTTGQLLRVLTGHTQGVNAVTFSPDGSLIASKSWDETIKVWDAKEGTVVRSVEAGKDARIAVQFTPDGKALAIVGRGNPSIRFLEVRSGKEIWERLGFFGPAGISISPDGRMIAAAGWGEKAFKLWEPQSGKLLRKVEVPVGPIISIAFSPDGKILATGGEDGQIKLWDVSTGKELRSLVGKEGAIFALAFSPDGRWLSSGERSGLELWPIRMR